VAELPHGKKKKNEGFWLSRVAEKKFRGFAHGGGQTTPKGQNSSILFYLFFLVIGWFSHLRPAKGVA
jgi:hypothetical protein